MDFGSRILFGTLDNFGHSTSCTTNANQGQIALLATDGMLVKRPILIGEGFVLVGFKEAEWVEKLK